MFRSVSKIIDGKRVLRKVELTIQEGDNLRTKWAENETQQALDDTEAKRKKLIANALDIASRAAIAGQITAIDNMSDAALDAALAAEALS